MEALSAQARYSWKIENTLQDVLCMADQTTPLP